MTDIELARRIESGDNVSAENFVRDHYPAVLRLTFRLAGRLEDAEDIAQETFITARKKISSFRGGSSFRTWIHKIAVNEFRQWRRKAKPDLPLELDQGVGDPGIAAFESGHVLLNAMRKLPPKQLEAFVLFEIEQFAMEEVAQILRVPTGTAKARVFYARQSLRIQLQGKDVEVNNELKHSASNG